jgi:aryl-alcohol dehydrogenase-like predicted oxidoreductase
MDERATCGVIHAALEAGVTFIDTAISYGDGQSERFIGTALAGGRRGRAVIATKFNFKDVAGDPSVRIREHCEESLRKLRTDYIDLFQIHGPSDAIATSDMLACLADLKKSGKIRAYGASNYSSWRVAESHFTANELGVPPFASVQNHYNLLHRQPEQELIQALDRFGLSLIPYHPLGGGFLTGKYKMGEPAVSGTHYETHTYERVRAEILKFGASDNSRLLTKLSTQTNWAIVGMLSEFARDHGHTVSELAIAWLASKPYVGSVIAGVSSVQQLQANIAGAEWQLSEDDCREIERLSDTGENAPVEHYRASLVPGFAVASLQNLPAQA